MAPEEEAVTRRPSGSSKFDEAVQLHACMFGRNERRVLLGSWEATDRRKNVGDRAPSREAKVISTL